MTKLAAAGLLALTLLLRPAPAAPGITVSAAASLIDAMEAVADAYHSAGGDPVRFNFAGSNVLARQIASGAPVDVFISADEAQMDFAQQAGAIDTATRVDLLENRLAVVTRHGMRVADARGLAAAEVRRIALGDPGGVPAGVYARQYLGALGLWEALQPKAVTVGNVRAALAAVENGSADAAVVYESDAAASSRISLAFVVSGPAAPRIVYPAAVVTRAPNRAGAVRFLAFLGSGTASGIFSRFKFTPRRHTR